MKYLSDRPSCDEDIKMDFFRLENVLCIDKDNVCGGFFFPSFLSFIYIVYIISFSFSNNMKVI